MQKMSMEEVLNQAIHREKIAHSFYTNLINIVEDKVSKDTLLYMANEELKHKEFLEKYKSGELGGRSLNLKMVVDGKVLEALGPPEITERLEHKDIFLVAAEREKGSHEFYAKLAALQPEGELKRLLLKLAQEELAHKEKAEYLYCNAAFPQTDGG
jgi:rubrerythrin